MSVVTGSPSCFAFTTRMGKSWVQRPSERMVAISIDFFCEWCLRRICETKYVTCIRAFCAMSASTSI